MSSPKRISPASTIRQVDFPEKQSDPSRLSNFPGGMARMI
jgi:hypothetical protein